MPVKRGSQHRLLAIKETVYGTTPATPTMLEILLTRLRVNKQMGVTRSGTIRQHPFVDRMLPGRKTQDLEIGMELQTNNMDLLFEMLAAKTFSTDVLKMGDGLTSMTLESQAQVGAGLFDHFLGAFVNRMEISFSANEDAAIAVTIGFGALSSELDATATLATAVTEAVDVDPLVFFDSVVNIAGVARPVTALTIRAERTVEPLWVGGSYLPRENVPGDFTLSGSLTIPYEDAVESARLEGFVDADLEVVCLSASGDTGITFAVPKLKYMSMGKEVAGRGARYQEIDYEAYYDRTEQTVLVITRDNTV
ncbi:tail subunit [Caulobacter phage Sansa]|uniref:Tail subunit n=1 Tax=Caulobacter phage Sansa TaxID=1675600 RepID=A0A0K1LMM2_9CAUD|nr:tail subunit [Caulobacter phage Sansa]AKU43438.1 tail subunit [Caulobacter phage Sansa]